MPRRAAHAGFSLLEVVLSLGLMVVLLSGVYAAIRLQLQFSHAGRGEVAYAQLSRGLIKRVDADLGSILFALPVPPEVESEDTTTEDGSTTSSSTSSSSSTTSSSTSSTSSSSSTQTTQMTTPETELILGGVGEGNVPLAFGVYGTGDVLHITVNQPQRELSYTPLFAPPDPSRKPPRPGPFRASDDLVITYAIAPLSGAFSALQQGGGARPPVGLGRRTLDMFSLESAPQTLGPENIIAPEVVEVYFRYFDGFGWAETWDSRVSETLPNAIEVTFGYWSEPNSISGGRTTGATGQVVTVPHVFHIPRAAPIPPE